ncbi:SMC family ATPase [Glutamicibacter sp. JL.03c]|uniref:AAA family ATPase n=1 Tax=Glutamicibacter sp. JL.03c TaxID=2984842 RepID=UPI0021F74B89|nr:SMC family ATPase [Glutamicibacter sp. JL.03c]UYQ78725.1 SMC family ATPase [Glutamicibacter sp. JL.03c]
MRIHKLQIQAFGPFAGSEQIDFDELAEGGLFLLDGPTGAGKSSILDAICYALYGSLPGSRTGSRQIRSDHAPAEVAPEVTCELTIGDRRFEVTRSPAWMRPSKRGKNRTTEQKASSLLREFTSQGWKELSTRNDEVGHVLGSLLGLDRDQFTKVVMLPQGGFADFLRAKAKDREDLLANLFDTSDYARIEEEFSSRLAEERKKSESVEARLSAVEDAIHSEARAFLAGREQPDDAEEHFAGYRIRIEQILQLAEAEAAKLKVNRSRTGDVVRALDERRRLFARHSELKTMQQRYAENHEAAVIAGGRLEKDAQASSVRAYLAQSKSAQATVDECSLAWKRLQRWLSEEIGLSSDATSAGLEALRQHSQQVAAELAVAKSALDEEQRRVPLANEVAQAKQRATEHEQNRVSAEAAVARLSSEREELASGDVDQVAAGDKLHQAKECQQLVETQIAHAIARDDLEEKVLSAREAASAQELKIVEAEKRLLALRTEQLGQSALRLAAALEDGQPCLVCGSAEHPAPAMADADATLIDDEQIQRSEAQVAEARAAGQKAAQARDTLQAKLETAQLSAGGKSVAELRVELGRAQEELEFVRKHQTEVTARITKLEQLRARIEQLTARAAQAGIEYATAHQNAQSLSAQLQELDARLQELRSGKKNLLVQVAELQGKSDGLAQSVHALQMLIDARVALGKAESSWNTERQAAGFDTVEDFAAAILDDEARERLRQLHRADADLCSAIATLEKSEDYRAAEELHAKGLGAPSDEELQDARAQAASSEGHYEAAREQVVLAATRLERHDQAVDELQRLRADAGPVIEAYRRLRGLAEVIRGGGENLYKMTLSTYVLAARLEEVAMAATERLDAMSGGRYSLHHDDSKQGNAKSGLGLRVLDSWTGKYRETQTLSGGETFMASLALALGLADVISHHSGAVDMQTLFVDEGFGSLDAETLEEVMQALENLRAGGRTIGLVSHVAEMKQRITNRVSVLKTQHGSAILRDGLMLASP